ncbi:hypothetical protein [Streptomyces sp. NPDC048845]|uniref:hypothetical protein n=1 Tax=Streptomyces sp. NPDC048845 TaxID=3155390 RepID=UPI0034483E95
MLHGTAGHLPSYGFDLGPVVAHSLRAHRIRLVRRLVVLIVLAVIVVWLPYGALVWGSAVALAWVLGPSGGGWIAAALAAPWVFALLADLSAEPRLQLLVLPPIVYVALAVVYALDHAVALAAGSALRRSADPGNGLPLIGPFAARRITAITNRPDAGLPYDDKGRFVGAGRDVRDAVDIRLALRSEQPGQRPRPPGAAALLEHIGGELSALGGEGGHGTGSLPGISVARVVAMPADSWLERVRAGAPAAEPPGGARSSGEREHLLAQCVSRHGQLVVSLFVHTAFQGGQLRLVLRPQVMAPLHPALVPAGQTGLSAVTGIRGAAVLGYDVWTRMRKAGFRGSAVPQSEAEPVSLRERFALPEVTDLHQRDDADQYVVLMRWCVLRATESFLEEHGVLAETFSDEAQTVINNIQVFGDNNAPIQSITGGHVIRTGQSVENQETVTMRSNPARQAPEPERGHEPAPGPERGTNPGTGISIGGANSGTVQNAVGRRLSHVNQTGTGQGANSPDAVVALLAAFRADVEHHAAHLNDPQILREHAALVDDSLADPAGNASALRVAARSLPALVAGTAVQHTGEALAAALSDLL